MTLPISTLTDSSPIVDSSQQTPLGTSAAASNEKTSDLSPSDLFKKLLENYQNAYLNWSNAQLKTKGDLERFCNQVEAAHKKIVEFAKEHPEFKNDVPKEPFKEVEAGGVNCKVQ